MKRQGLSAKPYQPTQMMNSSTQYDSALLPCCFIFDVMGSVYLTNMEKKNFISQMEQLTELGNKSVTISKQDFMKLIEYSKQDKFDECFAILKELVDVKHINDTEGRTSIQYITRQPEAWKSAKNFVSSCL